jgi:hypothetical protein
MDYLLLQRRCVKYGLAAVMLSTSTSWAWAERAGAGRERRFPATAPVAVTNPSPTPPRVTISTERHQRPSRGTHQQCTGPVE